MKGFASWTQLASATLWTDIAQNRLLYALLALGVLLLLWLALREVRLWYWKQNAVLAQLETLNETAQELLLALERRESRLMAQKRKPNTPPAQSRDKEHSSPAKQKETPLILDSDIVDLSGAKPRSDKPADGAKTPKDAQGEEEKKRLLEEFGRRTEREERERMLQRRRMRELEKIRQREEKILRRLKQSEPPAEDEEGYTINPFITKD